MEQKNKGQISQKQKLKNNKFTAINEVKRYDNKSMKCPWPKI